MLAHKQAAVQSPGDGVLPFVRIMIIHCNEGHVAVTEKQEQAT